MENISGYFADANHTPNTEGDIYIIDFNLTADNTECRGVITTFKPGPFSGKMVMDYEVYHKVVNTWVKLGNYKAIGDKTSYVNATTGANVTNNEALTITYFDSENNEVAKVVAEKENGGLNEGYTKNIEVNEGYITSFDNLWNQFDCTQLANAGTGLKNILYPIGAMFLVNNFSNYVEPHL